MIEFISVILTFVIIGLVVKKADADQKRHVKEILWGKDANEKKKPTIWQIFAAAFSLSLIMSVVTKDYTFLGVPFAIMVILLPVKFIIGIVNKPTKRQIELHAEEIYNSKIKELEEKDNRFKIENEKQKIQAENELLQLQTENKQLKEKLSDYWICPYCDSKNKLNDEYCPHCGAPKH